MGISGSRVSRKVLKYKEGRETMTSLHKFLLALAVAMVFTLPAMAQDVSTEAQRYMIRGQVAMEDAKDISGFQDAVKEFRKATELAPEWGDAWFNLGMAQEKAGDIPAAIQSYKKYLGLSPNAPDRAEVETQIIKLEYRYEKAEEERTAAIRQRQADEYLASRLVGTWQNPRFWYYVDDKRKKKCTDQVRGYRIKITANGTNVTGTVIGTPTTHYDLKKCQSWHTSTNVLLFKATVVNGRLVGTWNVVRYSSNRAAGISKTEPWDIGIEMSSSGYSFWEIHTYEEPSWSHEWLKE